MHYRVHTCSVNRDFPVLVKKKYVSITGFSLLQYQLFSVLVTFFPCFINIFFLFTLHGFPCFTKNSDLQGFPCIGKNFFMFQLQGFPCFNNTFFLFWLHYFPVLLTFFPCLIYRVFPVLIKIQIYRDFPVLVTTFLCFNYRVFPAFITPFHCFGYIISLYWLQLFYGSVTGFSLLL